MISIRPYQARAIDSLLKVERGIVKAPAGSGKTVIGAAALNRWLVDQDLFCPRIVWLANTREQCDQAQKAVNLFTYVPMNCELEIGCYAAGINCRGADLVVLDECHHIASQEFRKCLDGHNGVRWGLSATPNRADDLRQDVFDLIGPIVCEIDREELIGAGNLAKAKVVFHTPNVAGEFTKAVRDMARPLIKAMFKKMRWQASIRARGDKSKLKAQLKIVITEVKRRVIWQCASAIGVFGNVKRNDEIVSLANENADSSTLLIVGSIEHGQALADRIPGSCLVYSKIGAKKRREAIERFRTGELRCMIATSLADEGLDVPRANVLILAAGGRSAAKSEQRTGRVLRSFQGKSHGVIHDFWDHQHYFLLAQSKARKRVYQQLGYEICQTI